MNSWNTPSATVEIRGAKMSPRGKHIYIGMRPYAYPTSAVMNGSRGDSEHEAHPAIHNIPRLSETGINSAYSS